MERLPPTTKLTANSMSCKKIPLFRTASQSLEKRYGSVVDLKAISNALQPVILIDQLQSYDFPVTPRLLPTVLARVPPTESDHGDEDGVLDGVPPRPEAHLGLGPRQDLLAESRVEHHHVGRPSQPSQYHTSFACDDVDTYNTRCASSSLFIICLFFLDC